MLTVPKPIIKLLSGSNQIHLLGLKRNPHCHCSLIHIGCYPFSLYRTIKKHFSVSIINGINWIYNFVVDLLLRQQHLRLTFCIIRCQSQLVSESVNHFFRCAKAPLLPAVSVGLLVCCSVTHRLYGPVFI